MMQEWQKWRGNKRRQTQMVVALAQALGHHLCVPNQYMGGGLLVKGIQGVWFDSGRNEVYSGVSTEASFEKMLY